MRVDASRCITGLEGENCKYYLELPAPDIKWWNKIKESLRFNFNVLNLLLKTNKISSTKTAVLREDFLEIAVYKAKLNHLRLCKSELTPDA